MGKTPLGHVKTALVAATVADSATANAKKLCGVHEGYLKKQHARDF